MIVDVTQAFSEDSKNSNSLSSGISRSCPDKNGLPQSGTPHSPIATAFLRRRVAFPICAILPVAVVKEAFDGWALGCG